MKNAATWLLLKHAHDASEHVHLSGTKVREKLRNGESLPTKFSRPKVAEVLIKGLKQN